MIVPQYTTPTFVLTFTEDDLDLTTAVNVYITFKTKENTVTKTGEDLTIAEKSIEVELSQDETGLMGMGNMLIQVNWTTPDGKRFASEIATYSIGKQLLQKVIT